MEYTAGSFHTFRSDIIVNVGIQNLYRFTHSIEKIYHDQTPYLIHQIQYQTEKNDRKKATVECIIIIITIVIKQIIAVLVSQRFRSYIRTSSIDYPT